MPAYRYDPARNAVKPGPVDYVVPPDGGSTNFNPQYLSWIREGKSPREWQGEVSSSNETGSFNPRPSGYGGTGTSGTGGVGTGGGSFSSATPVLPQFRLPSMGRVPRYDAPDIGGAPTYNVNYREMPTYTAPKWNESEIDTLTQKRAAPGLRDLRQQVQRITGRRFDNPQVGRMTLREALQGYGSGVSKVMGGASEAAASEYGQRFGRESANAAQEYTSRAAATDAYNRNIADVAKTQYGGAMSEWGERNAAAREEAKMNYGSSFEEWKTRNSNNMRLAESDFEGAMAKWKADTTYSQQQRGFEDAWERWKRQQTERQSNPQLGGA